MRDRFAAELIGNPARASVDRAPRLEAFLEKFLSSRLDLGPGTRELYQRTKSYLVAHFGSDLRIDRISRADASGWRAALGQGVLSGRTLRQATVCQHIRNAKTMFRSAVGDDLIVMNPFDRQKGQCPAPPKDWRYVTLEELRRLLAASLSQSWKNLLALCRLAGLRQGEALSLPWSAVDWQEHRLAVNDQKRKRRRDVPITAELFDILLTSHELAPLGERFVIPPGSIRPSNLWRDFGVIARRAGLRRWDKWCHTLRKNCETDWAQRFPQYVVSAWIGHDITVSAEHYLQVPLELFKKASQRKPRRRARPKGGAIPSKPDAAMNAPAGQLT